MDAAARDGNLTGRANLSGSGSANLGGSLRTQAIGAPLSLELRAGPGPAPRYRSALAARAWIEPTAVLTGARAGLAAACGAHIEAHLALHAPARPITAAHDPAIVVRAQITRTPLTVTEATIATEGLVSVGIDLR